MCPFICVGHGVFIVVGTPWYRPSSVFYTFSSSLVSCNSVCTSCIPIEIKMEVIF